MSISFLSTTDLMRVIKLVNFIIITIVYKINV